MTQAAGDLVLYAALAAGVLWVLVAAVWVEQRRGRPRVTRWRGL